MSQRVTWIQSSVQLLAQFEFVRGVSPSLCGQAVVFPVCLAQERYAQAR